MRVIYRSAARVQQISGWQPLLQDLAQHALDAILPFIKKHRICRLLLNLLSWLLVPMLVLLVGVLVLLAALHKYALQVLLNRLQPDEQLEADWTSGDVVSFVMLVDGILNQTDVKDKIAVLLNERLSSTGRAPKVTKILTSKVGFLFWKKQKNFNLDNHVFVMPEKWRGARLTEETLQFYINEICSVGFNCNNPPWGIYLIPYTESTTLTQSHAVLIRVHSGLLREHALEDIFPCDTTNINLKKFINKVFQESHENFQSGCFQKLHQKVAKYGPLILESPRIFLSDLICSYQRWSVKDTTGNQTNEDKRIIFWSGRVPRDLIHKIKDVAGTSSHVVLLSSIAGALRKYFQMTGTKTPEKVPCLFPVYEMPMVSVKQDMPSGFYSLSLPLERLDPVSQLHRLQSSVERNREFPVRRVMSCLATRYLPAMAVHLLSCLTTRKYPLIISNSFLSADCRNFLEHPVTSVCCWNSFQIQNGLSLSLIHYADKISLSVMSKPSVLQWPDLLVSCFQRQVYDLALALNVRIERKPSPPSSPIKLGRSLYFTDLPLEEQQALNNK